VNNTIRTSEREFSTWLDRLKNNRLTNDVYLAVAGQPEVPGADDMNGP
jgi:hypothetical protein